MIKVRGDRLIAMTILSVAGGLCSLPAGYSHVSNGKFDIPVTPAGSSTWGAIKALYR